MTKPFPFTPEQTRIAERIWHAFNPNAQHPSGNDRDALYALFAAAVINVALTDAYAAHRSCDEGVGPAVPEPTLITVAGDTGDTGEPDAATTFALERITSAGAGVPGPDRGEAALWFRTRIKTLPAVVMVAAELGFDLQCWQLAAYCSDPLIAEGALNEATAVSTVGLAAAEYCDDNRAVAIMHLACGAAAKLAGRLTEAMDHYDAAMPIMQGLDDVIGQANVMLCRGAVHMRRGELQEARNCQLNVLAITKIPALTALATGNLGSIALKAGQISEAIDCSQAALQIIEGASLPALRQVMEVNHDLAGAYLASGDLPSARRHVEAALAAIDATRHDMSFASVQVAAYRIAGELALAEGKPSTALREFTRALAVRSGSTVLMADLLEGIGRATLANAGRVEGLAVLHAALAQRRVDGVAHRTADTLALLADTYQAEDPQQAADLRNEAIGHLEHLRDESAAKLRHRLATISGPS